MLARLVHRGPDDSGRVAVGDSWLGHRRLSIVDVAGGHQPLSTADGELHLVANGEIYNHGELHDRLGHRRFATASDNEVALHLFDEEGPDALAELRGMFALCAAGADGRFVAARDPLGIKPLYWARRHGQVRFASELRAFDADWRGDVDSFPPGHYWTPRSGMVRFAAVQPPPDGGDPPGSPDEVLETVRSTVVAAVERRMMGDVPVGVFLSGGLDSSIIAAVAARHARREGRRLQTFAVGLEGSTDLPAARMVAAHLDSEHRERVYTADELVDAVTEVVRVVESYEPSLVRSAVPNYLLAELAAAHVKVVLTGEGADELFAGYEYLEGVDGAGNLQRELVRTVEGLHHLNLQRCDRVTMAHGLEARVPFLDLDVVALSLGLPARWKRPGPGKIRKQLLREAFAGWMPDEVLWRGKEQFGDGTGATAVLGERMADSVTDAELHAAREDGNGGLPPPRSREELAYQRTFRRYLAGVRADRVLGRFPTH